MASGPILPLNGTTKTKRKACLVLRPGRLPPLWLKTRILRSLQILTKELSDLRHCLWHVLVVKAHVRSARDDVEFFLALRQLIRSVTVPFRTCIAARDHEERLSQEWIDPRER